MKPKKPLARGDSVLLHICCAPDASYGVPALQERFRVTGFFFNPNIQPGMEYDRRLSATLHLTEKVPFPLEVAPGGEEEWEDAVRYHTALFGERANLAWGDYTGGGQVSDWIPLHVESAPFSFQISVIDHDSNISVFNHERNVYSISVSREF